MKSIMRYISRNWLWIVAGLILKEAAVKSAYATRCYLAYGGEWLTLPLVLMLVEVVRCVGSVVGFLLRREDNDEPYKRDR